MSIGLLAPLVALTCTAAFGLSGSRLSAGIAPRIAAWTLVAGSVVAAISGAAVLALMALPLLGEDDVLADHFHWSARVLARDSAIGRGVAAAALLALVTVLIRFCREGCRQRRAFLAARKIADVLGSGAGRLVVVPDERVDVFALGGRANLIVATDTALRALSSSGRRAVLAHERSHLRHRHHQHLAVAALAVSLNPLLLTVPAAMAFLVERWADEDAATIATRSATAEALAKMSSLSSPPDRRRLAVLATASAAVSRRIAALEAGPLPAGPGTFVPLLFLAAALIAATVAFDHTFDAFRLAIHAASPHVWRTGHALRAAGRR